MVADKIILTLKLKINREKHNKWKNREQDSKSWNFIFLERTALKFSPGLKKKQPTRRSNTRPKSFVEKTRKKKNKIQSQVSPPLQTVQHVSHLAGLQAPCPPLSNATTNTGLREGNSYP
ncbi:hypothetical protein A4A49_05731 [Nicotiana attenuata]|uniref:Uncharacterized protein n=1 Tax=Nicotiana attenuata TaxID=49451 RepID=A0A1J6IN94_NICAT|nr:hypothetical protein A4A49_05731 [Nicotiana attenuata]